MDLKNYYELTNEEQRLLEGKILLRRAERRRANRRRIQRNRIIALIILLFIIFFICRSCTNANKGSNNAVAVNINENSENSSESQIVDLAPDNLSGLRSQINTSIGSYSGTWSVYVKNLNTGYSISINNRPVYAASEIKLYAMAAAYQQIADGVISEDDVYNTLSQMVANSSNEAFNSIVWTIGKYYISDWCIRNGYNDTIQCHGVYPAYNADGLATSNGYNLTTVEDMGRLLESIYRGECISAEYSKKMLNMLFNQHYRSKIPAGVPQNVRVANKTGETDDVSHDAAIVYSDNADYILTVMVDAPGAAWACSDSVVELSKIIYEYFN